MVRKFEKPKRNFFFSLKIDEMLGDIHLGETGNFITKIVFALSKIDSRGQVPYFVYAFLFQGGFL